MYYQFAAVLIFTLVGTGFVVCSLLIGALIRQKRSQEQKHTVYECGEPTIGSSWIRYNSRFYNVALVYLLFDVEVVLLVPALLVFREICQESPGLETNLVLAFAVLVFLGLLALGLAYEWFYGNLDWIRKGKTLFDTNPDMIAPSAEHPSVG